MYIKRKVFSKIEDENGEEKCFSTTEVINEETYHQKEFGVVNKVVNKVIKKPIKRLGRNARLLKAEIKAEVGPWNDFSNKEVGLLAANRRRLSQGYNNLPAKAVKHLEEDGGKNLLKHQGERLSKIYRSGDRAEYAKNWMGDTFLIGKNSKEIAPMKTTELSRTLRSIK